MGLIWFLQNLDNGTEQWFTDGALAKRTAERIVGNRAVAQFQEIHLYGSGDGTTSVMLRYFSQEDAISMGYKP